MNYVINVFLGFIVTILIMSYLIDRGNNTCSQYSSDPGQCVRPE
jgi:hypothetical protein